MKTAYYFIAAVAIAAAPALAANPISQDQLETLITGNTLYVTVPAGAPGAPDGGVAPIYFGADGSAVGQTSRRTDPCWYLGAGRRRLLR